MVRSDPLWTENQSVDLPRAAGRVDADVCVVGLGGSGLACVHALLDAGLRVVGIDAVTIANGAAGRNGGFLLGGLALFHHDVVERLGADAAKAIYEATLAQIDRMQAETPDAIRRVGTLRIASSAEELEDCARQLASMRSAGLPVEEYQGPEGRGLLFPRDASFNPGLRCRLLAERAIARGARLFGHSPATRVVEGHVATPDAEIHAGRTIVTVDGALEKIFPELGDRVRSARLQMLASAPAPEVSIPRPVYARWGLDYWQQLGDKRVVLGGFRDAGGDEEWTMDATPSDRVQDAMTALLRSIGVCAEVTHRWAATVAYTPSGLPILCEMRPGVWAAGAYSGTGNVIGALCGRAAAELAFGRPSAIAELLRA